MSAVVVAVLNRKGGVGKTSLVKDLGYALAELGVARAAGRPGPAGVAWRCSPGSGSTRRRTGASAGC